MRLAFNGYWLQQLTDHRINGIIVPKSLERLGPGLQFGSRGIWFRLNGYSETDVRNRPSGIKVTFRISPRANKNVALAVRLVASRRSAPALAISQREVCKFGRVGTTAQRCRHHSLFLRETMLGRQPSAGGSR